MQHCAIDLGGRKSQVCLRDADGTIQFEGQWATSTLGELFRELPPCRVIVETAAEAFRTADLAKAAGHDVRVVPATLVRTLGVGARRTKNDRRDAQVLSEVSSRIDLPSVHVPSPRSREWKTMTKGKTVSIRVAGSRDALITADVLVDCSADLSGLDTIPTKQQSKELALTLQAAKPRGFLHALSIEIDLSEKRIAAAARAEPVCRRMMTVPGVGPSTAVRYVAALDVVARFASAHKVEAYLGLSPGEKSSSQRQHKLGITKAGPSSVRWVLIQAAWILKTRCRGEGARPLQGWATEVEKRRGKHVAIVALARKLAGILYAIWRDGTEFETR